MEAIQSTLKDVYYNPKSPACYAGANAVYAEAKRRNKSIKLKHVRDFLTSQNTYTLHKPVRKRFKRNVTKTAGIDVDWQADLADMNKIKRQNKGYAYILICIDVLSRYVFAEPIKRKTPQQVSAAFVTIMKRSGRKCWILTTDRGLEFAKPFQQMLQRYDIRHHYATSPDVKCAIVERYIRTLKSRIWRYFTQHKTLNYVSVLPALIEATNNSYHRTIGRAPAKVTKKNETEVWQHLYGEPEPKSRALYKPGDQVRITKEKHKLSKGYLPNFTNEVFVVTKILKHRYPATYKLADLKGELLGGIFYNEELVRVIPSSETIEAIDSIIKSEERNKQLWHLVKWKKTKKDSWIKNKDLVTK